tara:strand:+ start:10513 stop:11121 length:609 start_codon:yes stop_codon:yes gene_type:complete
MYKFSLSEFTDELKSMVNAVQSFFYPKKELYVEVKGYGTDDITSFIRSINLEILLGNLDVTPKTDRLDKKTIKKCRKLTKKGFTIGGSVLLKASGILDRKCGDIDVFGDIQSSIDSGDINKDNVINSSRDYGDTLLRYKIKDPDLGELDIFQLSDDYILDKAHYIVDGIKFKEPISTLEIKLSYFRKKDAIDLWYIKEKLGI